MCGVCVRSRTRPLLFRGRIPMENLDVEDIEDGTGYSSLSYITPTITSLLPSLPPSFPLSLPSSSV